MPGPGPGDDGLFVYRDLFNSLLNGLAFSRMICRNGEPVDFVFLAVNTAFTTQTGMTDVVGKRVCDLIPGFAETDRALLRLFNHVVTTGSPDRFEYFVSALGKWFLISAYSPKAEHFVAIFEDISARKQIEETLSGHQLALKQSEERYRTLTERAPIALVVHSGGQLIYANPAAVNLAGAKGLQDLLGRGLLLNEMDPRKPHSQTPSRASWMGLCRPPGAPHARRIDVKASRKGGACSRHW